MNETIRFDVIIIGGSYSGLAAGMALGRALRNVLIIDDGKPCNIQTPYSHNFVTQDGKKPADIYLLAKVQVEQYNTVNFLKGAVINATKRGSDFEVRTAKGETFKAKKLIFATGIRDIMQDIDGYASCWGISVLHCPYCHGYEVRNEATGILGNGESAFELSTLISNWTKDLTVFTNGPSTLSHEQIKKLKSHDIKLVEKKIKRLDHAEGQLNSIVFDDGTESMIKALYARSGFEQSCHLPGTFGCEFTDDGYLRTDVLQKTTIPGIFACGDNATRIRTIANAVAMGTTAGMMTNREIIFEEF